MTSRVDLQSLHLSVSCSATGHVAVEMDHGYDKFLTFVLKELLEKGFIKISEHGAKFLLNFPYTKMAELAAEILMELLKNCFSYICDFFNNKEDPKNPIVEIIKKVVNKFRLMCDKITSYIKAAIDLLYKLVNGGFNCGKEKMRNGSRFVNEFAKTVVPLDYPPNSRLLYVSGRKEDSVRKNPDEHETIVSVTETRTVSRNVKLIQERSVTRSDEMISGGIIGNQIITNSKFKGNDQHEKKLWYHVGNVHKETSEQDILDYLIQNIPDGKFICKKLFSKNHESSFKGQSFKIGANSSSKSFFEDPNFWPKYVKVRPFQHKKSSEKSLQKDSITKKVKFQACVSSPA